MAIQRASAPPKTHVNGENRQTILVQRSTLVHALMDLETLATEAISANGYALQTVMGLLPSEVRYEAQRALIDTHDRLVRLLNAARLSAGRYDGRQNGA